MARRASAPADAARVARLIDRVALLLTLLIVAVAAAVLWSLHDSGELERLLSASPHITIELEPAPGGGEPSGQ